MSEITNEMIRAFLGDNRSFFVRTVKVNQAVEDRLLEETIISQCSLEEMQHLPPSRKSAEFVDYLVKRPAYQFEKFMDILEEVDQYAGQEFKKKFWKYMTGAMVNHPRGKTLWTKLQSKPPCRPSPPARDPNVGRLFPGRPSAPPTRRPVEDYTKKPVLDRRLLLDNGCFSPFNKRLGKEKDHCQEPYEPGKDFWGNREKLCASLFPEPYIPFMYTVGMLTLDDGDQIQAKPTRRERVERLLDILEKRFGWTFDMKGTMKNTFHEIMVQRNDSHLTDYL